MPLDPIEIVGGLAIGEGLGGAIADTVEPRLQSFKNAQWQAHQDVPLSPAEAAALAAQAFTGSYDGTGDAASSGIDGVRLNALQFLAATAPGTPELLELWRRGRISQQLVQDGLKKAGILDEFVTPLLDLFTGRLDPAVIATAIQRGIMTDPGFLPVGPPTGVGNVKAFPVSQLDPLLEAQATGIDAARLFVETAIVGLPLALVEAAQGYYRGILTLDDFKRAVAEGNTRNEWGDAALEVSRQIPTAGEYAELELRGFLTAAQRDAGAGKHGMVPADAQLLYDVKGRAPNIHAVTTGLARGGTYDGQPQTIPEPFLSAVQRADIRPEWYDIEYANRYTYPSAFVLRTLAEAGDLGGQAQVEQVLLEIGWKPSFATQVSTAWTGGATTGDPNVKKAHTKAWTEAQSSYIAQEATAADVQPIFSLLGVTAAAQSQIIQAWDEIRALRRKQLTPAQIKKAFSTSTINPATGAAWTQQEATQALLDRGYDQNDATVLLTE